MKLNLLKLGEEDLSTSLYTTYAYWNVIW